MPEVELLVAALRSLGSGVALWRLEDPEDPGALRLLLANRAASRWAGADLATGAGKRIGEVDPRAVSERRHELIARVALTGVAASIEPRLFDSGAPSITPREQARVVPLPGRCAALIVEPADSHERAEENARRLTT